MNRMLELQLMLAMGRMRGRVKRQFGLPAIFMVLAL